MLSLTAFLKEFICTLKFFYFQSKFLLVIWLYLVNPDSVTDFGYMNRFFFKVIFALHA